LVLTAFLGLNSLTGNEPNTSITTSSSQLSNDQDLPVVVAPTKPSAPVVKPTAFVKTNYVSPDEYAEHMQLSLSQLATVTLMLQVLDQADGGPTPTN
jgi:hypothetical protein